MARRAREPRVAHNRACGRTEARGDRGVRGLRTRTRRAGRLPGELYAVYLLQEAQGRGLGRALLETAARHMAEAGLDAWMCWVLADNPARYFYEAMGGVSFQQKDIEIGGRTLVEVAYGWK